MGQSVMCFLGVSDACDCDLPATLTPRSALHLRDLFHQPSMWFQTVQLLISRFGFRNALVPSRRLGIVTWRNDLWVHRPSRIMARCAKNQTMTCLWVFSHVFRVTVQDLTLLSSIFLCCFRKLCINWSLAGYKQCFVYSYDGNKQFWKLLN